MTQKSEFELIISPGNRTIFERFVAAVFFTCMIVCIVGVAIPFFTSEITEKLCLKAAHSLDTICYCLAGGIAFSMTKTVMIDTDTNKLISRFAVGPFSRDRISEVPNLEYVSIFLDQKENYQVNLWYKGNRHYKMYHFEKKSMALKFGAMVASKLQLDLLDATRKGDSQWIENIADHV